jgi:hypothetical protein
MEDLVTDCAATELAIHVDRALAARWAETGATLAVAQSVGAGPLAVALTPLADSPSAVLGKVPAARCVAACIASYGNAVRLDSPSEVRVPVLVTVAVTCCRNVILLRHQDGRVDLSAQGEGALIDVLRGWARLVSCAACRTNRPAIPCPDVSPRDISPPTPRPAQTAPAAWGVPAIQIQRR